MGVMPFLEEAADRVRHASQVRLRVERSRGPPEGEKGDSEKKRAKRKLHSEKEVLESRRIHAERKETPR